MKKIVFAALVSSVLSVEADPPSAEPANVKSSITDNKVIANNYQASSKASAQSSRSLKMADFANNANAQTLLQNSKQPNPTISSNVQNVQQGSQNTVMASEKSQDPSITDSAFYDRYTDTTSFPSVDGHIKDRFYNKTGHVFENESIAEQQGRKNEMAKKQIDMTKIVEQEGPHVVARAVAQAMMGLPKTIVFTKGEIHKLELQRLDLEKKKIFEATDCIVKTKGVVEWIKKTTKEKAEELLCVKDQSLSIEKDKAQQMAKEVAKTLVAKEIYRVVAFHFSSLGGQPDRSYCKIARVLDNENMIAQEPVVVARAVAQAVMDLPQVGELMKKKVNELELQLRDLLDKKASEIAYDLLTMRGAEEWINENIKDKALELLFLKGPLLKEQDKEKVQRIVNDVGKKSKVLIAQEVQKLIVLEMNK